MSWTTDLFGTEKPIIAMCHFAALPGDPGYDEKAGMQAVIDRARRDLTALQKGGVDGVMFSNEFSLPYQTKTEPIAGMAMARIIGELKGEIVVPHGVNVLWDPTATIDLAAVTDSSFVREIFTGVYASDYGLWNTSYGDVARHRRRMHAAGVRLLFNVVPESATYLGNRPLREIVKTTVFNGQPDALCVSGLTAGAATDFTALSEAVDAAGSCPVFVNTGTNADNIAKYLSVASGAVVGTYFKQDGKFENEVDEARVRKLMDRVKQFRSEGA